MRAFRAVTSHALALDRPDVDTDQIIPKQFLKRIERTGYGEFLLFDGRVHTYEAVNRRIDNVVRGLIEVGIRQGEHVGVLMETRPSALVAIAALSRLGAVAVLLRPDADLAAATRIVGVTEIITDPTNLDTARQLSGQILVLGGGESRDLHLPDDAGVGGDVDHAAAPLPKVRVRGARVQERAAQVHGHHGVPVAVVRVQQRFGVWPGEDGIVHQDV